jgi:hypothetical protein
MPYMRLTLFGRTSSLSNRGTVVMTNSPPMIPPNSQMVAMTSASTASGRVSLAASRLTNSCWTGGTSLISSTAAASPIGRAMPKSTTTCTSAYIALRREPPFLAGTPR